MSVLGLIDKSRVDSGFGAIDTPSTEFSDVFTASMDSTARNYLSNSKDWFQERERGARDRKYQELTGRDLYEDAVANSPNSAQLQELRLRQPDKNAFQFDPTVRAAVDQYIGNLKTQDANKFREIYNSQELTGEVQRKAKESLTKAEVTQAGATAFDRVAGNLAGGAVASMIDPINLATIPLGAGVSAGLIRTALVEAGLNVGAEIVSHPFVSEWQKELGQEYGPSDLAQNMGMAALFGAGMGAGAKAIPMGYAKAKSLMFDEMAAKFDEFGNFQAADAARAEARRTHIESADPAKLGVEVEPTVTRKALEEVDAAVNEGRALMPERIALTDEQVRRMEISAMDEGARSAHARMIEDAPAPKADAPPPHEVLDFARPQTPNVERQRELLSLQESPAWAARERADFDEKFQLDDERVFMDDETGDVSAAELRKQFKDDEDFLSAISSCGLGG